MRALLVAWWVSPVEVPRCRAPPDRLQRESSGDSTLQSGPSVVPSNSSTTAPPGKGAGSVGARAGATREAATSRADRMMRDMSGGLLTSC
ncbi:hypothetical protein [Nonomuraea salmonea]|uniref:hypothetical protein n=1 Tax=Nonomuraea salmonea TaxID=46181 RepID=UPI002FECB5E7